MILCSKLNNGLYKIVTKSQDVTKIDVTKSRLNCTVFPRNISVTIVDLIILKVVKLIHKLIVNTETFKGKKLFKV
jgi:hypothetical protein